LLGLSSEQERKKSGRIFVNESGEIVKQEADSGDIHNMLGAAASNDVTLAKKLSRRQLAMKDPFGRTPLMIAAWFESYEMMEWLCVKSTAAQLQFEAKCDPEVSKFLQRISG
jgi:hypothetical protein